MTHIYIYIYWNILNIKTKENPIIYKGGSFNELFCNTSNVIALNS